MNDELAKRYIAILEGKAKPETELDELFLEATRCGVERIDLLQTYMHLFTKFAELRTEETDAFVLGYLSGIKTITEAEAKAMETDDKGYMQ